MLLDRLPRGRVVALDASGRMIEEARRRLARYAERVEFVVADLGEPLPLEAPVDAVLSTATFHWVPDHDALFRNLAAVLRPRGSLVAQCGGKGNIASVIAAAERVGGYQGARNFPDPEETRRRLEDAGFVDVTTWLHEEPTPFEPGEPLETFLAAVILRVELERMPEERRGAYVKAVAANLPRPEIDYVRLNITARRGALG